MMSSQDGGSGTAEEIRAAAREKAEPLREYLDPEVFNEVLRIIEESVSDDLRRPGVSEV